MLFFSRLACKSKSCITVLLPALIDLTDGYQLNASSISDNILRQQQNTLEEKFSSQPDKNCAEKCIYKIALPGCNPVQFEFTPLQMAWVLGILSYL